MTSQLWPRPSRVVMQIYSLTAGAALYQFVSTFIPTACALLIYRLTISILSIDCVEQRKKWNYFTRRYFLRFLPVLYSYSESAAVTTRALFGLYIG